MENPKPIVSVNDFQLHFGPLENPVKAADGVTFDIHEGETVALVGESGSGKSVTALSLAKLVASPPGRYMGGSIQYLDREILNMSETQLRELRGNEISYIFQEPTMSLNPVFRVGYQIAESIKLHRKGVDVKKEVIELLDLVGIPDPEQRMQAYPHEMSGGMQQRVMIAIALACRPKLLVADEPTTALDVTIQAQILELLKDLQAKLGMSILLITHNLAIVADIAHRVNVMLKGKIVEAGVTRDVLTAPTHAYTKSLLNAVPTLDGSLEDLRKVKVYSDEKQDTDVDLSALKQASKIPDTETEGVLVEARDVQVYFGKRKALVKAVDGVDLTIHRGECVGLVGESGCGKTTLGRAMIRLLDPRGGEIKISDEDITTLRRGALKRFRKNVQMIFQDPYGSLNPRMTIGNTLREVLRIHGICLPSEEGDRIASLLQAVGLDPSFADRYPHEFSGGQRQRIGIARALAVNPDLIIADEPVSALDVSVQAQILLLMKDLQKTFNLAFLFVAHDLAVVRYLCDRVYVMYQGKIVETGVPDEVYTRPQHDYTRKLLAAVPDISKALAAKEG